MPTPTTPPNITLNPGFESGVLYGAPTDWAVGGVPIPLLVDYPHAGSYSLLVGWADPSQNGDALAVQAVTLPSDTLQATLRFWYAPFSSDTSFTNYQAAAILDTNWNPLGLPLLVSAYDQSWQQVTYDLTP